MGQQAVPRCLLFVLFAVAITSTYACTYNFRFTSDDEIQAFYIEQQDKLSTITNNRYAVTHNLNGQTYSPANSQINVALRVHNDGGPGGLVYNSDLLKKDGSVYKTFDTNQQSWFCFRPGTHCCSWLFGIPNFICLSNCQNDPPAGWNTLAGQNGWPAAWESSANNGRLETYYDRSLSGFWIWASTTYHDNEYVLCATTLPCPTCGNGKIESPPVIAPEACDDGNTVSGDGCDENCLNVEAGWTCPNVNQPCKLIDMCQFWGPVPLPGPTILSCVNDPTVPTQFTVNCNPGYYITGQNKDVFSKVYKGLARSVASCSVSPFCTIYGYSGQNAATIDRCEDNVNTNGKVAINTRVLYCKTGYTVGGPNTATPSVTLTGNAPFGGCVQTDTCNAYGPQTSASVQSCTSSLNTRVVVCNPGYAILGTQATTPVTSKTYTGAATFDTCVQIDTCKAYGYSGKTDFTQNCTSSFNSRNITCARGYFPVNGGTSGARWIVVSGANAFGGCSEANECTRNGYSGHPNFTVSCEPLVDWRKITCMNGYHAKGSNISNVSTIVYVEDDDSFQGCELIDNCAVYGYSNKDKTGSGPCVNGVDMRTITCIAGYALTGTSLTNISYFVTSWTGTPGPAVWPGCSVLDMCQLYGYSNRNLDFIRNCANNAPNQRNITCRSGYAPVTATNNFVPGGATSIVLTGSDVFYGCVLIPQCTIYGYSGNAANTASCAEDANVRTITCQDGYAAVLPVNPVITLYNGAPFLGCSRIDPCMVYGFSGTFLGTQSCVNNYDVPGFTRTLTCGSGYAAVLPNTLSVTLGRNVTFGGCQVVDMCANYGFSGNDQNTVSCVNGKPNERTITCAKYYAAPAHSSTVEGDSSNQTVTAIRLNPILLVGRVSFSGCRPICGDGYNLPEEACDDGNTIDGDGCSSTCNIEPGYVCPTTVGASVGTCCKATHGLVYSNITCHNGDYVSTSPTGTIYFNNSDWVIGITNPQVTLCGDVVLGGNGTTADPTGTPTMSLLPGSVLTIQGTLTLSDSAILVMSANSTIVIQPYCSSYQVLTKKRQTTAPPDQLHVSSTALVILVDPETYWEADNWEYGASLFTLSHCSSVTSINLIIANNKSNGFVSAQVPLITVPSSCSWNNDPRNTLSDSSYNLYDVVNLENSNSSWAFDVENHCAHFGSWATSDLWVTTSNAGSYTTRWAGWSKCLSTAQVVGIAVGCSVGVLLILIILIALVAGKGVGSAEDHYSAL